MCLVFCAFASWAVKTSDLQAPDAWKTGVCGVICCIERSSVPQFYPRTAFAELVGTKVALRQHQDGIKVAPGCWEQCSQRRSPGS
uniref:Secreted protein n=1 Tax=Coturnix japonica TaxID=93934 RepID=A0A8C2YB38_COTJA